MPEFPGARPTIRARVKAQYPQRYLSDGGLRVTVTKGVANFGFDLDSLVPEPTPLAGNFDVAARDKTTGEMRLVDVDGFSLGPIDIAQVTDATATGQAVVTASDGAAARSVIGAPAASQTLTGAGLVATTGTLGSTPTVNVPKASQAEGRAGSIDTKAMTPAGDRDALVFNLNLSRSDIPGRTIPFTRFNVSGTYALNDDGAGATYIRSDPQVGTGPMAIQDAAGVWFELEIAGSVEPRWFRLTADGTDWALAWTRAISALNATPTGGRIWVRRGTQTFGSKATFPKGGQPILVQGEGVCSVLTHSPGYSDHLLQVGDTVTPAGGCGVIFDNLHFVGGGRFAHKLVKLVNANLFVAKSCTANDAYLWFETTQSYGVTISQCVAYTLDGYVWYSDTSCHNLVFDRLQAFGIGLGADNSIRGQVVRTDQPSFNIVFNHCDIETFSSVWQTNGASAPRIKGCYIEYGVGPVIAVSGSTPIYNADITGNLFLGNAAWTMSKFQGGKFARNSVDSSVISADASVVGTSFEDNTATNGGVVPKTPFITPTFTNGWDQQANYAPAGYRLGADGQVFLQGNLVNGSSPTLGDVTGSSPFTLPVGYRPSAAFTYALSSTSGFCYLMVRTDGTIRVLSAPGAGTGGNPFQISLSGITFPPV